MGGRPYALHSGLHSHLLYCDLFPGGMLSPLHSLMLNGGSTMKIHVIQICMVIAVMLYQRSFYQRF